MKSIIIFIFFIFPVSTIFASIESAVLKEILIKYCPSKNCIISPNYLLINDNDESTYLEHRNSPPNESGLVKTTSEIINIGEYQKLGFKVIPYTVNEYSHIHRLLGHGVDGIISDYPNLFKEVPPTFQKSFQSHRGGRGLYPESTLSAFLNSLDHYNEYRLDTLELDIVLDKNMIPIVAHDPYLQEGKCRSLNPSFETKRLIKNLTYQEMKHSFVCDKLQKSFPHQSNKYQLIETDKKLIQKLKIPSIFSPISLEDLLIFVKARNLKKIQFNIETKTNPLKLNETHSPENLTKAIYQVFTKYFKEEDLILQSFDFRSLIYSQKVYPKVKVSFLIGDFPIYKNPKHPDSDDGANLQTFNGRAVWMNDEVFPYRQ